MSLQNEMRRVKKTNLEFKARKLRGDVERLCQTICINLDCSMKKPEELPIAEVDAQFDDLKSKWAELIAVNAEISRLDEELK